MILSVFIDSPGESETMSGCDHGCRQRIAPPWVHFTSLNTSHVESIRPALDWSAALPLGAALTCLGYGVMKCICANGVQFTLGAECKHVHVNWWMRVVRLMTDKEHTEGGALWLPFNLKEDMYENDFSAFTSVRYIWKQCQPQIET